MKAPTNYYVVTWKGSGSREIVRGSTFESALNEEGYGLKSQALIEKYEQISVSDAEIQTFISSHGPTEAGVIFEKLGPEAQASWRQRAVDHKCRNARTLPSKFPKIQ